MNSTTGNSIHENGPGEGLGAVIVSILFGIIAFILTLFTLLIFFRNYQSPNTIGIWVPIGITSAAAVGGLIFGRNSLKTNASRSLSIFSMILCTLLLLLEIGLGVALLIK